MNSLSRRGSPRNFGRGCSVRAWAPLPRQEARICYSRSHLTVNVYTPSQSKWKSLSISADFLHISKTPDILSWGMNNINRDPLNDQLNEFDCYRSYSVTDYDHSYFKVTKNMVPFQVTVFCLQLFRTFFYYTPTHRPRAKKLEWLRRIFKMALKNKQWSIKNSEQL